MKTIMIIPLLFYEIGGNLFITYYQELTTQKKMLRRNNDFFYFRFHCLQIWKHTDQSEDNMFIVYDTPGFNVLNCWSPQENY